jgi:CheY-like chemotaxis protein
VLLGDPYRITQILLNLASNSVKFTEKGTVRVACTVAGPPEAGKVAVEFLVQDTGVGIDAEYLARVFDDFSQEDSSVTRKFGGTGLGLGISKKLVELLGGELRIESEKNRGTTSRFTLRLPIGAEHDVPAKDGADVSGFQQALRGKRVLLVEDNVFNRMLASIFLTNAGLEVKEAENGKIAVAMAREQPFDVVLMDVQMPVMNGYEATAILREQFGLAVPIIALTANAITGERSKCLAAGMNDYLTKPFKEDSLVKMVYDWVLGPLAAGNNEQLAVSR